MQGGIRSRTPSFAQVEWGLCNLSAGTRGVIGYRWADTVYLPRSRQLPASLTADLPHMGGGNSQSSGPRRGVSKGFGQLVGKYDGV